MFGGNQDNIALIPLTTGLNQFGSERSLNIMVQTESRETYDEAIEYAKSLMRIIREVPFDAEDDFVIFRMRR